MIYELDIRKFLHVFQRDDNDDPGEAWRSIQELWKPGSLMIVRNIVIFSDNNLDIYKVVPPSYKLVYKPH